MSGGVTARQAVYLDNNATTQPYPAVVEAMARCMTEFCGNASSGHSGGAQARKEIESARQAVSRLAGGENHQLLFTSGASEANSAVLGSLVHSRTGVRRVVTTAVEHSSILSNCSFLQQHGFEILIVVFPYFDRLHDYPYQEHHDSLGSAATHFGWGFVDLLPAFQDLSQTTNDLCDPCCDIHPNERGHEITAEAIARHLRGS